MASTDPHFRLRLPKDLHDHLSKQALSNGRSVNAEIVYRLRKSSFDTMSISDLAERQVQTLIAEAHRVENTLAAAIADRDKIYRHIEEAKRVWENALSNEGQQKDI